MQDYKILTTGPEPRVVGTISLNDEVIDLIEREEEFDLFSTLDFQRPGKLKLMSFSIQPKEAVNGG